jgi:signal peptidase I
MIKINKLLKIVYSIFFAIFSVIAIFIVLTSLNIIQGYNFYVVMSGSMEPSIKMGSIVGTKEQPSYEIQDIITVRMKNNLNETYTHRIVEVSNGTYQTKGDANDSLDSELVSNDLIVGRVFLKVPLIGYLVNYAKQPTGFILMIIVPSVLIISMELNVIKETILKWFNSRKELSSSIKKDEKV